MNKIRDNIYLSGWSEPANIQELKANGITAVLNLALDVHDPDFFGEGITNVKVALGDCNYNKPYLKKFAVDVLEKLLDAGEVVLVHCAAGASRSPYIIGKYLERKEGRDNHDIMQELHQLRPQVFERTPLHDGD